MFEIQLHPEESLEYIPDFQNNRELAESWVEADEPGERPFFWVQMLPMSGHDYSKAHGHAFKKARKDDDFIASANLLRNRLISKYIPVVGGLKAVDRDGVIHQPKNGTRLVSMIIDGYPALDDILDDICEALKDKSKADVGDLKKLRQRSVGSSLETIPPMGGDAQGATQTMSTMTKDHQKGTTESPETVTAMDRILVFEWDPDLKQCPDAYLAEVWPMVRWWSDWEAYKTLPYGGQDLMSQPQFVVDVIRTCTETSLEVTRQIEKKLEAKREKERREMERAMRRARRY